MKLLIIVAVFAVLFFLFWLTSKDRSLKGMIGSITADFESHEPSPFAVKESFRGGHHSVGGGHHGVGGGHHGSGGGRYHGSGGRYRSYGSGGGGGGWGWWPWYWPLWDWPYYY